MSLFVGNISKNVDQKTIEKAFKEFGSCKVDFRRRYAFISFSKDRDAEDAKDDLNGKDFGGLRLKVEWSKKSGRFEENESYKQKSRRSRERSHTRKRSHSRSRSRDKHRRHRRRSHSRSLHRKKSNRRRSRSASNADS